MTSHSNTPQWLIYALSSGFCAALNGVFAKLTTTQLTSTWATAISTALGGGGEEGGKFVIIVEGLVRGFFFLLNLLFNAIMWGLFTNALRLASSTVRVSVMNTSANFMMTAILGWVIFRESLPGLWWLGAAMLVTGSVIIGTRDDGDKSSGNGNKKNDDNSTPLVAAGEDVDLDSYTDEPDAPVPSRVGNTSQVPGAADDDDDDDDDSDDSEIKGKTRGK